MHRFRRGWALVPLALLAGGPVIAAGTAKPQAAAADDRNVIRWPGAGLKDPREAFTPVDPVRLEVKDAALTWVLFKLLTGTPPGLPPLPNDPWPASYQAPPEMRRLDFLIAVRGSKEPRISLSADAKPWNELFAGILRDFKLGF